MKIGIYTVRDLVAQSFLGGLQLHKHPAPAIRTFADAAKAPETLINQHLDDFELVRVGWLDSETLEIEPDFAVVMAGTALNAAQTATTGDSVEGKLPPSTSRR